MEFETKLIHGKKHLNDPLTGSISFPIYQSATFKHPALGESTGYDYTREKNPTRTALEDLIASIENGKRAFAFATGMAAVQAILELFSLEDHIIVCNDLYGGSYRLIDQYKKKLLFNTYTDTTNIENIKQSIQKNTKAIFIETPSNPTMQVADIQKICELAKENNLLTIFDNTLLTPAFQKPLDFGADIVLESGSKFLSGHNDTLSGFLCVNSERLQEHFFLVQKSIGSVISPFDSWLTIRGIKTLSVRMKEQEKTAFQIANFLKNHKKVKKVIYLGLEEHPQYELSKKQTTGFGSMISFYTESFEKAKEVLKNIKIISFAESFGGIESLITHPKVQTHLDMPKEILEELKITDNLLRLSIGLENAKDLIEDLEQALQ